MSFYRGKILSQINCKELGPVIPILTGISRRILSGQKFLLSERQREKDRDICLNEFLVWNQRYRAQANTGVPRA